MVSRKEAERLPTVPSIYRDQRVIECIIIIRVITATKDKKARKRKSPKTVTPEKQSLRTKHQIPNRENMDMVSMR